METKDPVKQYSDEGSRANSNVDMSLTFGERACVVTYNPGSNPEVPLLNKGFARVIDNLHNLRLGSGDNEVKRMLSIAITEAQTAQMWAVKAVTWGDPT